MCGRCLKWICNGCCFFPSRYFWNWKECKVLLWAYSQNAAYTLWYSGYFSGNGWVDDSLISDAYIAEKWVLCVAMTICCWCFWYLCDVHHSNITVVDAVCMHTEYKIFFLLGVIPFSTSSVFQGSMLKRFLHMQSALRGWSSLPVCEKSFSCAGNNCHFYLLASRGLLLFSWMVQPSALGHCVCLRIPVIMM